jgi:sortase B
MGNSTSNSNNNENEDQVPVNDAPTEVDNITEHLHTQVNETPEESVNNNDAVPDIAPDMEKTDIQHTKKKKDLFTVLRIICAAGFVVFAFLFINEVVIQPWRANNVINQTRDLYNPGIMPTTTAITPVVAEVTNAPVISPALTPVPTQDPTRDEKGRLLTFKDLLTANEDTKGWINFPDTNIDYAVMQRANDSEYYLTHDFNGEKQKAGCLYLDPQSSVEDNTKNLVIHGHNMKSTDNMFHYLEHMKKDITYFKQHTIFNFDTIYQSGKWKVLSVFITNGSDKKEPFFNYMQSTFKDSSEFINFVYQIRIRSIYNLDQVDVNEDDQLCTLSTCSYELDNYRLVIVARKVREGEDASMDMDLIKKSSDPLYPQSYYNNYKKEVPDYPSTFEEALDQNLIKWYKAPDSKE